jgi:hypothetical protein
VVKHQRFELLAEEPTADEVRYFDARASGATKAAGGKA